LNDVCAPRAPDPRRIHEQRLAAWEGRLRRLRRTDLRIAWLRLALAAAGAGAAWRVLWVHDLAWPWLLLPAAGFALAAARHERLIRAREHARRAVAFHAAGLERLDERWAGRGDPGAEFHDPEHLHAADLDLFGAGSLFERLCTARTQSGRATLARWLCQPAAPEDLPRRQVAVAELARAVDLREDLWCQADAARAGDDPRALAAWAAAAPLLPWPWLPWAALAAAMANTVCLAGWLTGRWSAAPLLAAAAAGTALALPARARVRLVLAGVERAQAALRLLAGVLERLERERFEAPYLRELRAALDVQGCPASACIARLARLQELVDSRRNMLLSPLAALWMSGTLLALALERWRRRSGAAVGAWLDAVGRFEALASLATLAFERPLDPFPALAAAGPRFEAEGLGHPLLPEATAVCNDVRLAAPLRLLIVSGSNMSGKSTLLRAVGVNVVLAQAGGPVRARRLCLSPLTLGTCLHVRDSLGQGTSQFMAEITRLRRMLDAGSASRPLLFLLDELLHGTNSHDRRLGAEALIRQLLARGAAGLITTHDLALAEIADALPGQAANVHFEDRLVGGRPAFDYRLRPGVVRRGNALELMRSLGFQV